MCCLQLQEGHQPAGGGGGGGGPMDLGDLVLGLPYIHRAAEATDGGGSLRARIPVLLGRGAEPRAARWHSRLHPSLFIPQDLPLDLPQDLPQDLSQVHGHDLVDGFSVPG